MLAFVGGVALAQGQGGTTGSWQGQQSGFRAWIGPCKSGPATRTRTVQILSGWVTLHGQRKRVISSSTATPPIGEAAAELDCSFSGLKNKAFNVTLQNFSTVTGAPTTTSSAQIVLAYEETRAATSSISLASSDVYINGFLEKADPVGRSDERPGG